MTDGKLYSGQRLLPEQTLVSPEGKARLHYQGDGNLVVYFDGRPIWASQTHGASAGSLKMRADGDLVVSDASGKGIAHSRTAGHAKAMVQLQDDGNFVIYEDPDGPLAGTPVWASASSPFPIEDVEPEPLPDVVPLSAPLKVRGLAIVDRDGKLVRPKVLHAMWLFSAWCHGQRDRVREEMRRARGLYHGLRFCDHLGYYPVWKGMEVGPFSYVNRSNQRVSATPDYYGQLTSFLEEGRGQGLGFHHSRGDLNGLTTSQIYDHLDQVAAVQRRVGLDCILLNEACNEAWQNMPDVDDLVATLHRMLTHLPDETLKATSAADDEYGGETLEGARKYLADVAYKHGHRSGESYDRLRHIFSFAHEALRALGVAGWEGEPAGPGHGVTVQREDNVEALCMMGMMQAAFSQGATFMSGAGVFGRQDIWTMPGYAEWPAAIDLLPEDVMAWPIVTHGGDGQAAHQVFNTQSVSPDLRADQRIDPTTGRFVAFVYGPGRGWSMPVIRGCNVKVYVPNTLQFVEMSLAKGSRFDVGFEKGRFVLGQLR